MAKSTSKLLKESEVKAKQEIIEAPISAPIEEDIQDVQIKGASRKKFRINGDNNKILELNTNDLGVSYRLPEAYDRLNKLMDEVRDTLKPIPDDGEVDDETYRAITGTLKELNDSMAKEIDYIFDAPVSEICADGGSMYDPSEGMFRYEHIIDAITSLYETSLNHEFTLMRQRVANRVDGSATRRPKKATKKYTH